MFEALCISLFVLKKKVANKSILFLSHQLIQELKRSTDLSTIQLKRSSDVFARRTALYRNTIRGRARIVPKERVPLQRDAEEDAAYHSRKNEHYEGAEADHQRGVRVVFGRQGRAGRHAGRSASVHRKGGGVYVRHIAETWIQHGALRLSHTKERNNLKSSYRHYKSMHIIY